MQKPVSSLCFSVEKFKSAVAELFGPTYPWPTMLKKLKQLQQQRQETQAAAAAAATATEDV